MVSDEIVSGRGPPNNYPQLLFSFHSGKWNIEKFICTYSSLSSVQMYKIRLP